MDELFSKAILKDLELISNSFNLKEFTGSTVLITGANGLLASYLVNLFVYMRVRLNINVKTIALARNKQEAMRRYGRFINFPYFKLLIQDVCDPLDISADVNYIFHLAGNASPYYIKTDPVGIIRANILGTLNVFEFARKTFTKKVIFASTREIYGENNNINSLSEESYGSVNCLEQRSCYPESKRAAETVCQSYYDQYRVNFNTVRIAHCYGPGMKLSNDGRVMADFLNAAVSGRDIVLNSDGHALRSFCYVTDAIVGLLLVCLRGDSASAYNLSNEKEEVSIAELARLILRNSKHKTSNLIFKVPEFSPLYCSYKRVPLDTKKLEGLGWKPRISLTEGVCRTLWSFENDANFTS